MMSDTRYAKRFTTVKAQNIIVRAASFQPSGRYVLFNSLNHTWEELNNLKRAPNGETWQVLAVYSNCLIAEDAAVDVYTKLRTAVERGQSACLVPMPEGSDKFTHITACAECEQLEHCRAGYTELDNMPTDIAG